MGDIDNDNDNDNDNDKLAGWYVILLETTCYNVRYYM